MRVSNTSISLFLSLSLSFLHLAHSSYYLVCAEIQFSPLAFDVNFINLSGHRDYTPNAVIFRLNVLGSAFRIEMQIG